MFNYFLTKILRALRYVLETEEQALLFHWGLAEKVGVIYNYVGEHAKKSKDIYQSFIQYCRLIEYLNNRLEYSTDLNEHISIKLSQFGTHRYLVDRLAERMPKKCTLWIDAEGYDECHNQFSIARQIAKKSECGVGLTIQLKSEWCLNDVIKCFKEGIKVRLCKGAYPKKGMTDFEALRKVREVIKLYKKMTEGHDGHDGHDCILEIATIKDMDLVMLAVENELPLQVLYGWHKKFFNHPYGVTVYVPFGNRWLPYIKRRIRGK